jgi:hypothetical protein
VKRRAAAVCLAAAGLLLSAAPAQAVECADVFSKVRQSDRLAPFVVGDSVTVPAGDFLGEMGFAVDAVACRTFAQGLEVMAERSLPDLVVVALGSNGEVSGAELEHALELVGPFARLMLVLPKELGGGPDPDGGLMRAFADAHPDQVSILDWPAYSGEHGNWFAPDGLHLTTDGAQGFAQMIGEGVEFAPVEEIEPPRTPRRERRTTQRAPAAVGDPALAWLWEAVGRTIAAVLAPGVRLLDGILGDAVAAPPPDL